MHFSLPLTHIYIYDFKKILLTRREILSDILAKLIDQYVVFTPRGSWDTVKKHYSDERIKYTSRMNRNMFSYILKNIRGGIQKQIVNELPISPEMRLAVCLWKLTRGVYNCTVGEMVGIAQGAICRINKKERFISN